MTFAPAFASARAVPRPIPEVEPVITAFLPFSMQNLSPRKSSIQHGVVNAAVQH
jgi:hypothetical protein